MTHAAVGELRGLDMIIGDQLPSERRLVGGLPVEIKNFVARADIFFRLSMTIEAPLHVKHVRWPRERHFVKLAVAGDTTDAFGDMDTMVEKHEVGRVVHTFPSERSIGGEALAHGREHRRILPHLRMAGHARLGRRQPGEGGFLNIRVAIPAIQTEAVNVMFVAERNRLL